MIRRGPLVLVVWLLIAGAALLLLWWGPGTKPITVDREGNVQPAKP